MCGRYVIIQKVEDIEERFNLEHYEIEGYRPNFNVSPGHFAPVITDNHPNRLQMYKWGFTPSWSKRTIINARAEGGLNEDNDPDYKGEKGIISKKLFAEPLKKRRCLVIADAFYEGPKAVGLKSPYLCYLRNKARPFAFAGIWDVFPEKEGNKISRFSIITTIANGLLQEIGHPRSPVILKPEHEKAWLDNNSPIDDVLNMLEPYDADLMNAYPVSDRVRSWKNNDEELLEPVEETIFPEAFGDEFLE